MEIIPEKDELRAELNTECQKILRVLVKEDLLWRLTTGVAINHMLCLSLPPYVSPHPISFCHWFILAINHS
jgi:hypothetical protein